MSTATPSGRANPAEPAAAGAAQIEHAEVQGRCRLTNTTRSRARESCGSVRSAQTASHPWLPPRRPRFCPRLPEGVRILHEWRQQVESRAIAAETACRARLKPRSHDGTPNERPVFQLRPAEAHCRSPDFKLAPRAAIGKHDRTTAAVTLGSLTEIAARANTRTSSVRFFDSRLCCVPHCDTSSCPERLQDTVAPLPIDTHHAQLTVPFMATVVTMDSIIMRRTDEGPPSGHSVGQAPRRRSRADGRDHQASRFRPSGDRSEQAAPGRGASSEEGLVRPCDLVQTKARSATAMPSVAANSSTQRVMPAKRRT
jgi:hypothetical protein